VYLSDHAYAVFGLAVPDAGIVAAGVRGPGLTTKIPGGLSLIPIWTEAWKQPGPGALRWR
jgi:peptide/nickel transport system substrate-binding protein